MPDIINLALIATASFLGATIAVGYLYGLRLLGDWCHDRNAPDDATAAAAGYTAPDTGVYDWKNDAEVKWRR